MFLLFCLLIAGIVIWRGIMPFKIAKWLKITLSAAAFLVAFNFVIIRLAGLENMPVPVLLILAWCFSVQVLYIQWLVIYEFIYWSLRGILYWRKRPVLPVMTRWYWRAGMLLPAVLIASVGMYNALKMPDVREYEIVLEDLPPELDGMTIAHLSDIHADRITDGEKVAAIVQRVNNLNPDLIVLTGDMVDRRVDVIDKDLQSLGKLRAKYGVYGVPGNHEYYSGYEKWMQFLRSTGIVMLENQHVVIADGKIVLGGTTDPAAEKMNMEVPDLAKTFANAPERKMRLLLAHQPKVAAQAADANVALQLSGHTHGGMLYGFDMVVAAFNYGMISGEYDYGKTKVFVSNGTGIWSGFPVRFGRGSEIVLLRLRAAKR